MTPEEKKQQAADLKNRLDDTFAKLDTLTADVAVKTAKLKQDMKSLKAALETELAQRAE